MIGATIESRAEGAAVGAAVGDLLGSVVEGFDLSTPLEEQRLFEGYKNIPEDHPEFGWKAKFARFMISVQSNGGRIEEYLGHLGTGFWEYGETTDDTAQWYVVAKSLVERGKFDPGDIANGLVRWYNHGYAKGLGGTSLLALRLQDPEVTIPPLAWNEAGYRIIKEGPVAVTRHKDSVAHINTPFPANGAVMRISPLGIFAPLRSDFDLLQKASHDLAIITHAFDETVSTSQIISELVARLINGEEKSAAIDNVADRYAQHFERSMQSMFEQNPKTGGTYETTGIAITALLNTTTFREAIEHTINATHKYGPWANDVDTYGAVTGALAGAYYGYDAIPESWYNLENPLTGQKSEMIPVPASEIRFLGGLLFKT